MFDPDSLVGAELSDGQNLRHLFAAIHGRDDLDHAEVSGLAAIAIIQRCWRNTELEDWHASGDANSPTDYEMFVASVTLTRAIIPAVTCNPINVAQLRAILTDPARQATETKSAEEFCGPVWQAVAATAESVVDALEHLLARSSSDNVRLLNAIRAMRSEWWGAPGFDEGLEASLRTSVPYLDDDQLRRFVQTPESMPEEVFWATMTPS